MSKTRKARAASPLQEEIKQTVPFRSARQAAVIGILRTADVIKRRITAGLDQYGLTVQQYNVLRILRGSSPEPLATMEIAERMIERTPGITRLLDRLEAKGLVQRERCPTDRRIVHCRVTREGLDLLARLDPVADRGDVEALGDLSEAEAETLAGLLDRIRTEGPGGGRT